MKLPLGSFLFLATTMLFLAGCDPDSQDHHSTQKPKGGFNGQNHHETPPPETGGEIPPTEPAPGDRHEKPDRAPQSPDAGNPPKTGNTPPPATGNPEYGKAVPGKPGFVTSPYAPYQGYVDVRGYAPGTEVKDPYTGKIFLVPAQ